MILELLQLHCITAKKIVFLPKRWSFFIYATSMLKIDLLPKFRKFLNDPASLSKIGFFAKILEFFWCIMHQWWNFCFLPTSSNFFDYFESPTKSWISCQSPRTSWITMRHCHNLGFLANILDFLELYCITSGNLDFLPRYCKILKYVA